jgi:outer membrane protein TolC
LYRALILIPAFVATGCASYEPAPLDPLGEFARLERQTLDAFRVEHARAGEEAAVPRAEFDAADGLDESELVAVALTLNPDLRARRLEAGEARALLVTAGLWPNPEIDVSARPGMGSTPGTAVDLDLLFELLRPGERSLRKDVAGARVEAVLAEIASEEWELAARARVQRVAVLAGEQSLALLEQEAALRERGLAIVRRKRELGEGTELDVSTAELDVAEVRRDLRRAETDLESARRELNRLLGLPPGYPLRLSDSGKPFTVTDVGDLTDDALGARLVRGRMDLRAMEKAYAMAEGELHLAVLRRFPTLRLGPSYGREPGGDGFLGLALALELPLFDRNQGEIAEKRSARERARAAYVAALHRLRAAAVEARGQVRRARLEVEAQEKEVLPLVERNRSLFEGAVKAGELGVLDWVTALQRGLRARQAYLESLVRYQTSVVEYEAALGASPPRAVPGE